MKRIGLVYKYSEAEGKGILVYGTWKQTIWNGQTNIVNTPLMFSVDDLLSEVKTGQLVYFTIENGKISNIECASLTHFNIDYIDEIIGRKRNKSQTSFFENYAWISFEALDDIKIPKKVNVSEKEQQETIELKLQEPEDIDIDALLEDLESLPIAEDEFVGIEKNTNEIKEEQCDDFSDFDDFSLWEPEEKTEYYCIKHITESRECLPDSIEELYKCFGKYSHTNYRKNDSVLLDVFNLSYWIDDETFSSKHYGCTIDEIKYLYDVFVIRKKYDCEGKEVVYKQPDDSISPCWSILLSKFNDSDLLKILEYAPKLQPALPVEFCMSHLDALTDQYGMPNVEVCKCYCLEIINRVNTISQYKSVKSNLRNYSTCYKHHLYEEGTHMCMMGSELIDEYKALLEEKYNSVVWQNVKTQVISLANNREAIDALDHISRDVEELIAEYIEAYNNLNEDFLGWFVCENVDECFTKLPDPYHSALYQSLKDSIIQLSINAAKSEDLSVGPFCSSLDDLEHWIDEDTKKEIKNLVNSKFSKLSDLWELSCAFDAEFITEQQYILRYKELTRDYDVVLFAKELSSKTKVCKFLKEIQWYIVSNIIHLLDYKDLYSHDYIKLDENESISDIETLLIWLNKQNEADNLDDDILKMAEDEVCSFLSEEEKTKLLDDVRKFMRTRFEAYRSFCSLKYL